MDFELSDEQRQLDESIGRFLAEQYAFERFQAIKRSPPGWDRETWRALGELGVLAINVPTAQGGLGYGALETLSMMGAGGKSLVLEPLLGSAVIATAVLRAFASQSIAAELLTRLASGDAVAVLAHFEPESRFEAQWVTTRATRVGDTYRIDGHKSVVMHAQAADMLLVSARTSGAAGDPTGVTLFCIARDTPGVSLDTYPIIDGRRAADIYLQGVEIPDGARLGVKGEALGAIEAGLDFGLAGACAEAVGVMQALLDATVDYVKIREQFGQPIGRFQALQHRIAEMVIHLEQAGSMSYLAALRCDDANLSERRRALSAAKTVIGQAGRFIGQQAVQLHGGMGMTDELKVSHLFKRLTALDLMFGDSDTHLQRFAGLNRS